MGILTFLLLVGFFGLGITSIFYLAFGRVSMGDSERLAGYWVWEVLAAEKSGGGELLLTLRSLTKDGSIGPRVLKIENPGPWFDKFGSGDVITFQPARYWLGLQDPNALNLWRRYEVFFPRLGFRAYRENGTYFVALKCEDYLLALGQGATPAEAIESMHAKINWTPHQLEACPQLDRLIENPTRHQQRLVPRLLSILKQ